MLASVHQPVHCGEQRCFVGQPSQLIAELLSANTTIDLLPERFKSFPDPIVNPSPLNHHRYAVRPDRYCMTRAATSSAVSVECGSCSDESDAFTVTTC